MELFKDTLYKYLLIVVLGLIISNVSAQDVDDVDKSKLAMNTFLDAEKNKMLENYPEAAKLYEKTIDIDSEYDPAMFELGRMYLYQQKFEEALFWVEKAHKIDPTNKWYSLLLVDLYRNNYQIADAIDVYLGLLEQEPTNTDYLLNLSRLYHTIDDYKEAIATLEKVEKLEGIVERTSFLKRDIYLQEKDFDKAVATMIELSNTYPQEEKYCLMIAEMYMKNRQAKDALVWYDKVLSINPDNPYIQITLADFYVKMGDKAKAYEYLKDGYANPHLDLDTKVQVMINYLNAKDGNSIKKENAFELAKILTEVHPTEPKSFAIYGDLFFQDSLYAEASQQLIKSIALDSSNYAIWEELLYSLSMERNDTALAEYSQRTINLFPEMDFPYYVNAISNYQLGNTKKVISALETGLYFVSNDQLMEQFYMFLGDAYHTDNQNKKAYEAYEKALKLNPDNSLVLNNYSYYLSLENKQLEKAAQMAKRSIEIDPNANNLDTYGWVLYMQKNYEDAKKYIGQAIDVSEDPSPEVLEHMGDVYLMLGELKMAKSYWRKAKKAGGNVDVLNRKLKRGDDRE